MVDDLINGHSSALREKGERAFRSQVDETEFASLVDQMYQAYGTPLEFELKNAEHGIKEYPKGENKDTFKFGMLLEPRRLRKDCISCS